MFKILNLQDTAPQVERRSPVARAGTGLPHPLRRASDRGGPAASWLARHLAVLAEDYQLLASTAVAGNHMQSLANECRKLSSALAEHARAVFEPKASSSPEFIKGITHRAVIAQAVTEFARLGDVTARTAAEKGVVHGEAHHHVRDGGTRGVTHRAGPARNGRRARACESMG